MRILYEKDGDVSIIRSKQVTILGYGSQGRAHALNLRDSGVDVVIGLRTGRSWDAAIKDGFIVQEVSDSVKSSDVVMMLLPDESMRAVYYSSVNDNLKEGASLLFAHGFNVHYNQIIPRVDLDVSMVAPKAPGYMVRETYVEGHGVPHLIAVWQDWSGSAKTIALSYAIANGAGSAGIIETTFRSETETDLFGEQAVLCGGLVQLIKTGFEVLVESNYEPELAYFECLHEAKLIVDLIYSKGIGGLNNYISNNAEFGEYIAGPQVINCQSRQAMVKLLKDIRSGHYAKSFILEGQSNSPIIMAGRRAVSEHLIEIIGKELRSKMKWLKT